MGSVKAEVTFFSVLCQLAEADPNRPALTCGEVTLTRAGFAERRKRPAALFAGGRAGQGVQVHRVSTGSPARGERTHPVALARAGPASGNGQLAERPGGGTRPEAA